MLNKFVNKKDSGRKWVKDDNIRVQLFNWNNLNWNITDQKASKVKTLN